MRLIPRGDEVAEVVALLEADGYDSAEALAKDIIKTVVDFLWFREWHLLVIVSGEHQLVFGPYASEAEAVAHGKLGANATTKFGTVKTRILAMPEERAGGGFGYCVVEGCGHPAYGHSMAGTSRGKCVLCDNCPAYEQVKKKPRVTRARKAAS